MSKNQKLELTWIGKENQPRLEPRILVENAEKSFGEKNTANNPPFTRIEEHNFSKYTKDSIHLFTDTITPASLIPGKVFSGFRKACHNLYKFASKTEKDFAIILENDKSIY